MNAIDTKAKRGKCLALFAVLAVAFVALAAVPTVDAADKAPATDLTGMISSTAELKDGAYVLNNNDATVTLTNNVNLKDIKFEGKANTLTITSSGDTKYTLNVEYDFKTSSAGRIFDVKSLVLDGANLTIVQKDTGKTEGPDSNAPGNSVFGEGSVEVKGTSTMKITTNEYTNRVFYNNGSSLAINGTNAHVILERATSSTVSLSMTDGATLEINNPIGTAGNFYPDIGNTGVDCKITVTGATSGNHGLFFYGTNSNATSAADGILKKCIIESDGIVGFYSHKSVDATGSTINANKLVVAKSGAADMAKVTGATLNVTNVQAINPNDGYKTVSDKALYLYNVTFNGNTTIASEANVTIAGTTASTVKSGTLSGNVVFAEKNATLTINKDASFDGIVSFTEIVDEKNVTSSATVKIKAAGENGFTLKAASIDFFGAVAEESGNTITITSGTAKITENFTVPAGMKIVVENGAALAVDDSKKLTVAPNATVEVSGTVTGTVENNGTITTTKDGDFSRATITPESTGTVVETYDDSGMENIKIEGIVKGTANSYDANQIVTIVGNTTITSGSTLTVNGKLVIPAGVTLTLESGAKLIIADKALAEIDGNIDLEENETGADGTITINGTMNLAGTINASATVNVSGKLNVNENGNLVINDVGILTSSANSVIAVNKAGIITMNGTFNVAGKFTIAGTVTFDSEKPSNGGKMTVLDGASIAIKNIALNNEKFIEVSDGKSKVTITAGAKITSSTGSGTAVALISGIELAETITVKTNNGSSYNDFVMELKGSAAVSPMYVTTGTENDPEMTANVKVTLNGSGEDSAALMISEGFVLGKNTAMINSGVLNVKSEIDGTAAGFKVGSDETKAVANNETITLADNGKIVVKSGALNNTSTINAAKYETGTTTEKFDNYVTIDAALVAANDGTTKSIAVLGTQTVTASATIPADVKVDLSNIKVLNIGADDTNDVKLTIASGASVKNVPTSTTGVAVNVNGTIDVADKTNVDLAVRQLFSNGSDVYSEELNDKGVAVRNGWAKWTNIYTAMSEAPANTVIKANKDITIKSNLTIPTDVTLDTNNKTVTVKENIVLTVDGTLLINKGATANTVVLEKAAENKKDGSIVLNGFIASDNEISILDSTGAVKIIDGAYYSVTTSGATKYYATTVQTAATKIVNADAQTITLKGGKTTLADIEFSATAEKPGKVVIGLTDKLTAGTITLAHVTLVFNDKEFNGTVKDAAGEIVLSGTPTAGFSVASSDKFTVTGSFTAGVKGKITTSGTVEAKDLALDTVAVSGTLNIAGNVTIAKATVNGSVNVGKDATLTSAGVWEVLGTLTVAEDATGASFTIMYVGLSQKSVAAAAVVDGAITFSNYVAVAPGSQIPESISSVTKKTEFYIGSDLYLTVYAGTSCDGLIASINGHIKNAYFDGWYNENGKKAVKEASSLATDAESVAIFGDADFKKVTAKVVNEIYTITISTGAGIENVAIDGVLYHDGMTVAYGSHTVTYTLKTCYEGTPTLYVNGKAQSGMTFTTEGTPSAGEKTVSYTLQLSGVSATTPVAPTVEDKDDGMGLTDILLIILVVLIAVMAIIVALRLMRS